MLNRLLYAGPSIDTLHEEYAGKGRLDDRAPVRASREVRIDAPVERVWGILADVEGWGRVNPDVRDVRLDSPVAEGVRFTWVNGAARLRSRFAVVEPERELTWTGQAFGVRAVHRNVLEPLGAGETLLRSEESMSSPLLTLYFSSAKLHAALGAWLEAIRSAAEEERVSG